MYALLGHRIRRAVVAASETLDAPVTLTRATDTVATALFEQSGSSTAETALLTDRLELHLHHTHLPKLAASDVLDYRPAEHTLAAFDGDACAQLQSASESLSDSDADPLAVE